jgi:iron complex outermembrane recepter protein
MTRSRRRKLMRAAGGSARSRAPVRVGLPLASAVLAAIPAAYAQQAQPAPQAGGGTGGLEEIVVTAEKRTQNLQDVPISIQALDTQKLEQLNISDIDEYVKYLSGVTTVKGLGQGGNGVGTTHMYMRGVVSGQDGNHSGSQPSVGTYLDEQPITTIDGTPDIHIYDIARIEVLEGPQGTLYGASSEAGTIRIITNKPDTKKFSAAYDVGINSVDHGGIGSVAEGYVNFPLSPIAAIRLVGWDEHDAGFIHNVAGTNATGGELNGVRTFPSSGLSIDNSGETDSHYNPVSTIGGRVAALLRLGDNWTVTPTFLTQSLNANGFFGMDPNVGDLQAVRYGPESNQDSVTQTALTIEGKVSDFDITYSGGWFVRETHTLSDYSDYTYFYDKFFGSGCNWVTTSGYNYLQANPTAAHACFTGAAAYPAGDYAEPQEYVITNGHYTKWSHELRLTTPQNYPVKGIVGLFAERQVHEIWEQYTIPGAGGNPYTQNPQGLAPALTIPNVNGNTIWLTDQERVDRDQAAFGQVTWDLDQNWEMTGGIRFYKYDNSIQGFYGYSANYQNLTGFYPGQNICFAGTGVFHGAPCQDLDSDVSDSGRTYKANLTYKIDPRKLVYFTYSTGYRPGGVNRVFDTAINAVFPPYKADFLTNWEVGWKTTTDDHTLRWNGALFLENWNNFQFLFLGPNSVTVVQNAASAQIKGIETELEWAASSNLLISGGATYLHAVTTANYCGPAATIPGTTALSTDCPNQVNTYADGIPAPIGPEAPSGTQLPVAPKFKANLVARYTWASGGDWESNIQASGMYQTETEPLLRLIDQIALGPMPAYALVDLSAGSEHQNFWYKLALTNVFDKRAQLTRFVECATTTCGPQPYIIPSQPRTIALTVGQRF